MKLNLTYNNAKILLQQLHLVKMLAYIQATGNSIINQSCDMQEENREIKSLYKGAQKYLSFLQGQSAWYPVGSVVASESAMQWYLDQYSHRLTNELSTKAKILMNL